MTELERKLEILQFYHQVVLDWLKESLPFAPRHVSLDIIKQELRSRLASAEVEAERRWPQLVRPDPRTYVPYIVKGHEFISSVNTDFCRKCGWTKEFHEDTPRA